MRTIRLLTLALTGFALASCMDRYLEVFTANSPVYMSYETLRTAVKKSGSRNLVNPGKIYFKDNFLYVVEELKGVHLIDLATPSDPRKAGFIEIPGCMDIAIKNNILFADSYIDLVAVDISDPANIRETDRVKKVFPYTVPPTGNDGRIAEIDQEKGVVVDWEIKKVRQEMESVYYPVYPTWKTYAEMDFAHFSTNAGGGAGGAGNSFGIGGSMARFGLYGNNLYAVDDNLVYLFDVTDPASPFSIGKQGVGSGVETMFIYGQHMFLGTTTGMRIYSLATPSAPVWVSDFMHTTSCDPVVIAGGYAYITLRGGTACNNSTVNQLDVVKLSDDLKNNYRVAFYPMEGPYGLGIDGDVLFVCDGEAGLKVFNAADKTQITSHLIATFKNIRTYDVIPVNGYLFMIGEDGFFLYDYSNLEDIRQIGHIPVARQ